MRIRPFSPRNSTVVTDNQVPGLCRLDEFPIDGFPKSPWFSEITLVYWNSARNWLILFIIGVFLSQSESLRVAIVYGERRLGFGEKIQGYLCRVRRRW